MVEKKIGKMEENLGSSRILKETRLKVFFGAENGKAWFKFEFDVHPAGDGGRY